MEASQPVDRQKKSETLEFLAMYPCQPLTTSLELPTKLLQQHHFRMQRRWLPVVVASFNLGFYHTIQYFLFVGKAERFVMVNSRDLPTCPLQAIR